MCVVGRTVVSGPARHRLPAGEPEGTHDEASERVTLSTLSGFLGPTVQPYEVLDPLYPPYALRWWNVVSVSHLIRRHNRWCAVSGQRSYVTARIAGRDAEQFRRARDREAFYQAQAIYRDEVSLRGGSGLVRRKAKPATIDRSGRDGIRAAFHHRAGVRPK